MQAPRCQNKVRARDGSLVRCCYRAFWVVALPETGHHLICKVCGTRASGVDLRPVEGMVREFNLVTAEPAWPARYVPTWAPVRPKPEPRVRRCMICGEAVADFRWCTGCNYWVARQSPLGKRTLHALARYGDGTNLITMRFNPSVVRGFRNIGPKSVQWLLEVELPRPEKV
jgi:hypothetical protein